MVKLESSKYLESNLELILKYEYKSKFQIEIWKIGELGYFENITWNLRTQAFNQMWELDT